MPLIGELFDGPVDIVGDVHGELTHLESLLKRLGYDDHGRHTDGRRLVFVGDLTDRGPDSPGVVRLVSKLVDAGRAQAIVGNHELNIMRGDKKDGNAWFFGEPDQHDGGVDTNEVLADQSIRTEVLEFFSSLPVAVEREDLRVVHACWDENHVSSLRGVIADLVVHSQDLEDLIKRTVEAEAKALVENQPLLDFSQRDVPPPMVPELAALMVRAQNDHPVKVLTSGKEEVAVEPFWAGGRWRLETRSAWWHDYQGPMVVVGHYWRSRHPGAFTGKGPDLFADTDNHTPLGKGHVMCVDYSIGRRNRERALGLPQESALAAYRWPEKQLVFSE